MAQDLLANCLRVSGLLTEWYHAVNPAVLDSTQPAACWIDPDPGATAGVDEVAQIPFSITFAFRDSMTAVMLIYYWASLVLFYPLIERIHAAIFQPVVDTFPPIFPNLPPGLQINALQYGAKEVRELAGNVCRSLDFALATTVQPDLLVVPLFVVDRFYREINTASGDGALELMWCEAFQGRLALKGQDIADIVQRKRWFDMAEF